MPRIGPSEIFESYAKLMEKNGLVSNEPLSKKAQRANTGKDKELSSYELLYGIKPDQSEGMEYAANLAEVAHPDSVILDRAHDKVNALIENVNERHNIMVNIINKPVNGHLTNHKLAKEDLLIELVKISNHANAKNEKELKKLADICISNLQKEAQVWQATKTLGKGLLKLLVLAGVGVGIEHGLKGFGSPNEKLSEVISLSNEILENLESKKEDFQKLLSAQELNVLNEYKRKIENLQEKNEKLEESKSDLEIKTEEVKGVSSKERISDEDISNPELQSNLSEQLKISEEKFASDLKSYYMSLQELKLQNKKIRILLKKAILRQKSGKARSEESGIWQTTKETFSKVFKTGIVEIFNKSLELDKKIQEQINSLSSSVKKYQSGKKDESHKKEIKEKVRKKAKELKTRQEQKEPGKLLMENEEIPTID